MKRYRVVYRPNNQASELVARTEEVLADGWRVDTDKVVLYQKGETDTAVFDVPTARVMRIQEIGAQ